MKIWCRKRDLGRWIVRPRLINFDGNHYYFLTILLLCFALFWNELRHVRFLQECEKVNISRDVEQQLRFWWIIWWIQRATSSIFARTCSKNKVCQRRPTGRARSGNFGRADQGGLLYPVSKKLESKSRKAKLSSLVTPNAQSAVADIYMHIYIYMYISMHIYIYIHSPNRL